MNVLRVLMTVLRHAPTLRDPSNVDVWLVTCCKDALNVLVSVSSTVIHNTKLM